MTGTCLTVGTVTEQYHVTISTGQVINQGLALGTGVGQGSEVEFCD